MINDLVGNPPIVLQNIVVLCACRNCKFLYQRLERSSSLAFLLHVYSETTNQDLLKLVVWDVRKLCAMEFRDHKLDMDEHLTPRP